MSLMTHYLYHILTLPRDMKNELVLHEEMTEMKELRFWKRFGENVGKLLFSIDIFNSNSFVHNVGAEMMKA